MNIYFTYKNKNMSNSIFLSRLFWPLFIIVVVSFLLNRDSYKKVIVSAISESQTFTMFMLSYFRMGFWLFLVLIHNQWSTFPEILVSLLWVLVLVKGLVYLFFPSFVLKQTVSYLKNSTWMTISLTIWLFRWLLLTYYGYFA